MKLWFGCLVQKALGARNCVGLGLAALFKRLEAHEIVCAYVWLPCSKGFRRMKLCGPRLGCLVQKIVCA